jgi:hypothetical protein
MSEVPGAPCSRTWDISGLFAIEGLRNERGADFAPGRNAAGVHRANP